MIDLEHVSKEYKRGGPLALDDINLHVDDGEFVFLLGHSGAGKSTLLKLLLREELPSEGKVTVLGKDVARLRRHQVPYLRRQMGIIFQDFRLIPTMTVYENIAFAMHVTNVKRKEIRKGIDRTDMEKLAASIVDTLSGEHYIKAVVGIGTPISNVKDLATSFKEAQIAMEVSKVFDTEKQIIRYDNLGIARLIYQLPTTVCEMFLREVFKQGSIESLDQETLFTIQRFFENNLNVSETSRGLFVHRNTLVYRLEKIKKLTGLDLREFDDAIVFKVALMVKKYLSNNPAKY